MKVREEWTDGDFEQMGWHDSQLYSLKFPDASLEMELDLDYIFKWEEGNDGQYKFWVSPCKMIFHDVMCLEINVNFLNSAGIYIASINRKVKEKLANGVILWNYCIEADHGKITFETTGFHQEVRIQPILSESQSLPHLRRR